MLLTLTVFLLLVAQSVPPQSKSIPLAGRLSFMPVISRDQISGADPGGGGVLGVRIPKHHKEGENLACLSTKTPRFST